jgi:magnesium and cobalt transporter
MSEEPPQSSFLEKIKNIFLVTDKKNNNIQAGDEKIEEIIQNVIDIKDSVVSEIMIPRVNISSISESDDIKKVMLVLNDTKHSRYPVFSADNKNVLGVLHVKDLLNVLGLKEENIFYQ